MPQDQPPDAETSTFARVASGYRRGGAQATLTAPPTCEPDTVVSHEFGIKGRIGDFAYDASAHPTNWDKVRTVSSCPSPALRSPRVRSAVAWRSQRGRWGLRN